MPGRHSLVSQTLTDSAARLLLVTPNRLSGMARWIESWLPGAASEAGGPYPGERLGLPEQGPRSVARMGRRLAALCLDWLLCTIIALGALHAQIWTIVVFAAEVYLLTAVTGFTVGKRMVGIRVARLDGKPVGFVWALVRTLLLLTVIAPVVTDGDLRGLHDRAANTVVIRI